MREYQVRLPSGIANLNGTLASRLREAVAMELVCFYGRQIIHPDKVLVVNAIIVKYPYDKVMTEEPVTFRSNREFKIQYLDEVQRNGKQEPSTVNLGDLEIIADGLPTAKLRLYGTWPITDERLETAIVERFIEKVNKL